MASPEKQRATTRQSELHKYVNLRKGAANTVLSPSYNARVEGYNLSFNEDDPQQGLFLIATSGHTNAGTEIRLEDLSLATSTKIIFRTPDDLIPGPCQIFSLYCFFCLHNSPFKQALVRGGLYIFKLMTEYHSAERWEPIKGCIRGISGGCIPQQKGVHRKDRRLDWR